MTPIRSSDRIVLAYSGDLASSIAVPWLAAREGAEIVTVTLDLGQDGRLDDVRERALGAGAVRAHVIDAREELARDFVLPALHVTATGGSPERLAAPLARVLIAKHLAAVAALEQASVVAHAIESAAASATFARIVRSINPRLRVIAVAREARMTRAEQIDYARGSGIPVIESGEAAPRVAPRKPAGDRAAAASVAIRFERGVPVAVNEVDFVLVDLIGSLATLGAAHGVGRAGWRKASARAAAGDAPAFAILKVALHDLLCTAVPAPVLRTLAGLGPGYADVIAKGRWFTPARDRLEAFLDAWRSRMTGTIRLSLQDGTCRVTDRDVPAAPAEAGTADEPFLPPSVPVAPARA